MEQIIDIYELREIQMDILSYIDQVCRDYKIKYSISYGTLLGAIRHKGYIPWDDDIDIMLTRDEYDRLIQVMTDLYNNGNTRYRLLTNNIDREFCYPFAKVVDEDTLMIEDAKGKKDFGVYVDVFPIDSIPDANTDKMIRKIRLLYNILVMKSLMINKQRSLIKNIIIIFSQILLLPISNNFIINKIDVIARQSNRCKESKMACLVWGYGKKEIVPSFIHEQYIDIQFEDRVYMSIKDYHIYLTNLYGDYMKLPPIEKRVSTHTFQAFWK